MKHINNTNTVIQPMNNRCRGTVDVHRDPNGRKDEEEKAKEGKK
jgi:hypothetical protein